MEAFLIRGNWTRAPLTLEFRLDEAEWRALKQAIIVIHNQRSRLKGLTAEETFAWKDFRAALEDVR
jgi:hypothetical protein